MKIVAAKYVLPVSSAPIKDGAVAFEGNEIAHVGTSADLRAKFPDASLEDLGDAAILPGFVNCHSHLELTAMRGLLDEHDGDFASWLTTLTRVRAEVLSEEQIANGAVAGAIEGARAGVTCFGDIGRIGRVGSDALKAVGLRGVVYQETEFAPDERFADEAFTILRTRFEILRDGDTGLVSTGISPHSPYTVSEGLFRRIAEYATAEDVYLTTHASESNFEEELLLHGTGFFTDVYEKLNVEWEHKGISSIKLLARTGILGSRTLLAHCVQVSDEDLKLIADSDAAIAHCPKSNAKFGHGIAPLGKFYSRGIKVGLGSDSVASNNTVDMFEEARFATLVARNTPDGGAFIDPALMLETATLGGARAMGLGDVIGSLEKGKRADIVAVSLTNIAQRPVHDIHNALLFATSARDVMLTLVDGKEIYREGKVLTVDEDSITQKLP